jgi:hypothetical protein
MWGKPVPEGVLDCVPVMETDARLVLTTGYGGVGPLCGLSRWLNDPANASLERSTCASNAVITPVVRALTPFGTRPGASSADGGSERRATVRKR